MALAYLLSISCGPSTPSALNVHEAFRAYAKSNSYKATSEQTVNCLKAIEAIEEAIDEEGRTNKKASPLEGMGVIRIFRNCDFSLDSRLISQSLDYIF